MHHIPTPSYLLVDTKSSLRVSFRRSFLRERIRIGIIFTGDMPEANLQILSVLLRRDFRVEFQE